MAKPPSSYSLEVYADGRDNWKACLMGKHRFKFSVIFGRPHIADRLEFMNACSEAEFPPTAVLKRLETLFNLDD